MSDPPAALRGKALRQFLAIGKQILLDPNYRKFGDLDEAGKLALLRQRMGAQPVAPGNCRELEDLCHLWYLADGSEKACRVMEEHSAAVLSQCRAVEADGTRIALQFAALKYRLNFDAPGGAQALAQLAQTIRQLPARDFYPDSARCCHTRQDYWQAVQQLAQSHGVWALAEQALSWQKEENPDACAMALARAALLRQRAHAQNLAGEALHALERRIEGCVREVMAVLAHLPPEDDAWPRWEALLHQLLGPEWEAPGPMDGPPILPLLPRMVPEVLQAARAQCHGENPAPMVQAWRKLLAAKFLLKAHCLTGNWAAAVGIAAQAAFNVEDAFRHGDAYACLHVLALEKTGQLEKAAAWMLQYLMRLRAHPVFVPQMFGILARLLRAHALPPRSLAICHLLLAWRQIHLEVALVLEMEELALPPGTPEEHFARAQEICGNDPEVGAWVAYMQGWALAHQRQWAAALPLLERAAESGHGLPGDGVVKLWYARFAVLDAAQALARPWHVPAGAADGHNVGSQLQDPLLLLREQGLAQKARHALPAQGALDALAGHYWARALGRFDAFAATGQGDFADCTTPAGYSGLCWDMACLCRRQRRYAEALALHEKGMGVQAEWDLHHANALHCRFALSAGPAESRRVAEELWQRHEIVPLVGLPLQERPYVQLAQGLHAAGRAVEIADWLVRVQDMLERSARVRGEDAEAPGDTEGDGGWPAALWQRTAQEMRQWMTMGCCARPV